MHSWRAATHPDGVAAVAEPSTLGDKLKRPPLRPVNGALLEPLLRSYQVFYTRVSGSVRHAYRH
jgi:hypothetical protein